MADFFIRRPIVAIVIAILTVLLGVVTLRGLSVEQYPFLAPPNIRVTATYPGASAEAVEQSVATPIEQEVNGVDRLIYMKSSNTSDGRMQLDVNFEVGTDQDIANVLTPAQRAQIATAISTDDDGDGVVSAAQANVTLVLERSFHEVLSYLPNLYETLPTASPRWVVDPDFNLDGVPDQGDVAAVILVVAGGECP